MPVGEEVSKSVPNGSRTKVRGWKREASLSGQRIVSRLRYVLFSSAAPSHQKHVSFSDKEHHISIPCHAPRIDTAVNPFCAYSRGQFWYIKNSFRQGRLKTEVRVSFPTLT